MHKFRLVVLGCASYAFMFGCATQKQRPTKKQGIALVSPEIINSSVGELLLPADSNVVYKGVFQESFPLGLPLSFGSGIRAHGIDSNTGDILLYGLSDRGPNSDSPLYIDSSSKEHASKIFLDPNYQPKIIRMKFNQTFGLTYVDALGIRTEAQAATGLPHPLGSKGATQEVALSDQLKVLGFDPLGIDPEGIDVDSHGSIWICEEYGPSLMKIDPQSGQIIEKYSPGQGLPEILSHRQPNRGFEGIAVSPNGRIYAALQSNLDIDGKTKKIADFIRIVEFDPETHKTRMFAYPIDRKEFSKFSEAKLGDILALDSQHLAVIEQGLSVNKTVLHRIQIIDLNNATDLSALKIEQGPMKGQELEFISLAELSNQGIKALSLNLLIDLN
ncbi:MAG: esterase-like activity of phytase family protein, partial [Proteobacteria bacterium]|nr:esterase-like activity of phytase family protein [Pseudomonadota bacterium]